MNTKAILPEFSGWHCTIIHNRSTHVWNFVHRDAKQRQLQFTAGSKVLEKKRIEKTRLPAAMYDVAAA